MSFKKLFSFNKKNYKKFHNYDDEYRNSIDEIIVHPSRNSCEPSTSVTPISNSFQSVDNLLTCIEAPNIKTLLNDTNKVLILKIQTSSKPSLSDLNEISQQCLKKSIIILLSIDDGKSFLLYWKSKEIGHFLSFRIYDKCDFMNDIKLFQYLANFLGHSLNKGHLGLDSKASVKSGARIFQLHHLADHRDHNLLLVAAESGDAYIVKLMLTLGISSEIREINAQSLAWKNRHFEVLSMLLKSNLIYPYSIYIDECPNDIQEFYEVSRHLNEAVLMRNESKVLNILTQNPEMIHYYNLNNESAPAFALNRRLFDMYKLLISKNILFGPHEKFSEIIEDMKESEREKLREIHYDGSKNLPDNHMHVLLSNSRLGHDTSNATKKYEIIQKAFETMNQNPFIQIILMIVAASRNFRIIFDFNRDSVEVVDPTADESTGGLFYSENGRIYIGAKKLLDQKTRLDALGVIAHELCHYVTCLVYKNQGNPYVNGDKRTEQEFKQISRICLENAGKEKIVDVVHECYPPYIHHAELVVRVPHLIMKFFNNPEKFNIVRVVYGKLFDVFENKIFLELKDALPRIEAEAETEKVKNKRKIKRLRMISLLIGILAVVGIIAGIYVARIFFYKPTYKFSSLSHEDQIKVENAPVIYKNISIVFHDLFPENSTAYDLLTSDDITQMLDRNPLNFSDPHYSYFDKLIIFTWENLTDKLKDKFINSNFSFQGETLSFKMLNNSQSVVFDSLSSIQIVDVLDDKMLSIHYMTKNGTQFYVERKIFVEFIYEIYFSFMMHLNGDIPNLFCKFENTTGTANDTFDKFYNEFLSLDYDTRMEIIEKIDVSFGFLMCTSEDFKINDPRIKEATDSLFSHKNLQINFKDLLNTSVSNSMNNHTRLFGISADTFTKTTVTFKAFPLGIKKEYPTRWITYLDFRSHEQFTKEYFNIKDVEKMLEQVQGLNSNNEFERKIFEKFFYSGNVIFFWDGMDLMFDNDYSGIMNVIHLIRDFTQNFQFLATSFYVSHQYRFFEKIKTYSFVPFDEENREIFLREFFTFQNVNQTEIPIYTHKVQRILNATELKQYLNTPLMLGMIGYTISNDIDALASENIYEIYGKYAEIKVRNSVEENEFMKEFLTNSLISGLSVPKYYQKYALLCFDDYRYATFSSLKLKAMDINLPVSSKTDEISKMGILKINSPAVYKFIHVTFAEYFTAHYFVENIYNADFEIPEQEAEMRLKTFYFSICYNRIFILIKSYFESTNGNRTENFNPQISQLLTQKYKNIFINAMQVTEGSFTLLLEFFEKDQKLFNHLLRPNESDSLYRATYDYTYLDCFTYSTINRTEIKNLAQKHLTNDEYVKFISLKDLKGSIFYTMYLIKQCTNSSENSRKFFPEYDLPDEILDSLNPENVLQAIANNLTTNEVKALLASNSLFYPLLMYRPDGEEFDKIANNLSYYKILWHLIEQNLSKIEQKNWLEDKMKLIFLQRIETIEFFTVKIANFLTNLEIHDKFLKTNILHYIIAVDFEKFMCTWNFFIHHSSWQQQKEILQNSVEIECYLNSQFDNYCYLVPKVNILQASIVEGLGIIEYDNSISFQEISKLYESFFNNTELQELIVTGSKDFIPFVIFQENADVCQLYADLLKQIFKGNYKYLEEFFLSNVEPTKLNIFDLLVSYNDVFDCVKMFKDLIKSFNIP